MERAEGLLDEITDALFYTLAWTLCAAAMLLVSPLWLPLFIWRRVRRAPPGERKEGREP